MMGVIRKTVELCTCDMCGAECDRDDGDIVVQVNRGDGRDSMLLRRRALA